MAGHIRSCGNAWPLIDRFVLWVSIEDRKAESDSEWQTNPFGQMENPVASTKNLIISIIVFIIFINFSPARLNSVPLLSSLISLYVNLFSPLLCFFHWRDVRLSITMTDSTQVAYGESSSFFLAFFFFFVQSCVGDAEALSENPICCRFCGHEGLPLTLTDSSQICWLKFNFFSSHCHGLFYHTWRYPCRKTGCVSSSHDCCVSVWPWQLFWLTNSRTSFFCKFYSGKRNER